MPALRQALSVSCHALNLITMKKAIFLSLSILFYCFLNAQTYQSIFGVNSTQWNTAWLWIDYTRTDTIVFEKDTIVNNLTWKKVRSNNVTKPTFRGGLLREETQSGKVWYKGLGSDTAIKLAFDFSLSQNDTFNIDFQWHTYSSNQKIVDTTFTSNGRKVIVFKATVNDQLQLSERVMFIEGIGSNLGVMYKDNQLAFTPFLLCSYKDGNKVYSNIQFNGVCQLIPTGLIDISSTSDIKIYPVPFVSNIEIENNSRFRFTNVCIVNTSGMIEVCQAFNHTLDLKWLRTGVYWLYLYTTKGEFFKKQVLKL